MAPFLSIFLLTREAKSLNLAQVFRLTDTQAETMFRNIRWGETDGAPMPELRLPQRL